MAHKKLQHIMTNIDAINSRHKNLWCHKKSWIAMKICDTLMPNGMPWPHHTKKESLLIAKDNNIFN
jgi:hypothetical protein